MYYVRDWFIHVIPYSCVFLLHNFTLKTYEWRSAFLKSTRKQGAIRFYFFKYFNRLRESLVAVNSFVVVIYCRLSKLRYKKKNFCVNPFLRWILLSFYYPYSYLVIFRIHLTSTHAFNPPFTYSTTLLPPQTTFTAFHSSQTTFLRFQTYPTFLYFKTYTTTTLPPIHAF